MREEVFRRRLPWLICLGALALVLQLVLIARMPWLETRLGMDRLTAWHRWSGFWVLWLLIALMNFERMPFLAMVKEAKMRSFVTPGELLTVEASVLHEGSGFAVTEAKVSVDGRPRCNATLTFRHIPFPHPDLRVHMDATAKRIGVPQQVVPHE